MKLLNALVDFDLVDMNIWSMNHVSLTVIIKIFSRFPFYNTFQNLALKGLINSFRKIEVEIWKRQLQID